jgi:hypothetical protein
MLGGSFVPALRATGILLFAAAAVIILALWLLGRPERLLPFNAENNYVRGGLPNSQIAGPGPDVVPDNFRKRFEFRRHNAEDIFEMNYELLKSWGGIRLILEKYEKTPGTMTAADSSQLQELRNTLLMKTAELVHSLIDERSMAAAILAADERAEAASGEVDPATAQKRINARLDYLAALSAGANNAIQAANARDKELEYLKFLASAAVIASALGTLMIACFAGLNSFATRRANKNVAADAVADQ